MKREHVVWDSPRLGRRMEILWFGHEGRPVIGFPTSMGRFYQLEDFGLIGALSPLIDAGRVQVCCVDGVDEESWYNKGAPPPYRALRHDQYDAYLHEEVFPYVRERAGRADLVTFGASFGAYHAMNAACRYPEEVGKVIAFSGLFDIHRYLDGYWDDRCYFHCPTAYVPNMDGGWIERLSRLAIVIAAGEHDALVEENRRFLRILAEKGIPAHGEIWSGTWGHDWPDWKAHLPRFLP